jgi:hypothetical protein
MIFIFFIIYFSHFNAVFHTSDILDVVYKYFFLFNGIVSTHLTYTVVTLSLTNTPLATSSFLLALIRLC